MRRKVNRTHWTARLLGIPSAQGVSEEPGLLIIQIDGLSRLQLEKAIKEGRLPFLSRLLRRKHFALETFYSGVPSTTPAVQGEIFYGERCAVPSFQFFRRAEGKDFRMYEAESADIIEKELMEKCAEPLLAGAHAYSNIYRAGANRSRYCSKDFAPDELLRRLHPVKGLVLCIAYAPRILRLLGLALVEFGLAVVDAFCGFYERQNLLKELLFVPARVGVCLMLREAIRFRVLLDIERGVKVIHANFLGYDEQAHRRGPDSAFAHWTLKGIDRTVRDIYQAAIHAPCHDYEMIVHSDHGQERADPFAVRHGREIDEALGDVFREGPLAGHDLWLRRMPDMVGNTVDRCLSLFGLASSAVRTHPEPEHQIIITAMGPVGHLYLPTLLENDEMERYAREMISQGVPLVLYRKAGEVLAVNRRGSWRLPAERAEILGKDHPFLDEAAADLVQLCHHPDAGEFVISGWDAEQKPLSFALENGAHGGPGSEETRGFLLLPMQLRLWHLRNLARTERRVRGEDLRKIVLHYLGREWQAEEIPKVDELRTSLRVMTYNIHSCRGLDNRTRPERVARVINHLDPDIVAVQEVDAHRLRSGEVDQAHFISEHLKMHHVFHAMFEEEKERYGIAVFSKYPIEVIKAAHLTPAVPSRLREARGAIWVKVKPPGGREFHFINTHFGLGRDERRAQAAELLGAGWLGGIAPDEPVILCGDFNSRGRSEVCRRIRERLTDVQIVAKDHVPLATFSSMKPLIRIDHVFVSPHFVVNQVEVPDDPTSVLASDHLPLAVELTLLPAHETQ